LKTIFLCLQPAETVERPFFFVYILMRLFLRWNRQS